MGVLADQEEEMTGVANLRRYFALDGGGIALMTDTSIDMS